MAGVVVVDSRISSSEGSARSRTGRARPWWASTAGLVGAILIHAALISALTFGAVSAKPAQRMPSDASAVEPSQGDGDLVSAIIYLDPKTLSSEEGMPLPRAPLQAMTPKDLLKPRLIRLAAPQTQFASEIPDLQRHDATSTTPADGAAQALLFGRYVSQIAARIDRAWVRPTTAPTGSGLWGSNGAPIPSARPARFACRVQIIQSPAGEVLEVTLVACDSSPAWQISLVRAINAASPLPAPPSEAVFARSLVLSFSSPVGKVDPSVRTASATAK